MTTPEPQNSTSENNPYAAPSEAAPSFPQTPTPDFDEATATPGTVTYGQVVEPSPQPQQAYDPNAYQQQAQQAYDPNAAYQQQQQQAQPGYDANSYQQPFAAGAAYTQQTGYQQQTVYTTPMVQKQMIVAALLAFFLGSFGVHNFYLGYTTRGIIQLILTITLIGAFVSGIWAFVEFILILMRSGSYGYDAKGVPLA